VENSSLLPRFVICYLDLGEAIIEHPGLFDVSVFTPMKNEFSQELQFIHRTGVRLQGPARLKNPGVNSEQ